MKRRQPHPPRHLETTHPVARMCSGCGAEVLAALVYGEHRVIDPVHINTAAKAMALVMGCETYEIGRVDKGKPMIRNAYLISTGLPQYGYIHPRHRCGMSWNDPGYRDERRLFEAVYTGMAPPF